MKVEVQYKLFGDCEMDHCNDCPGARLYVKSDRHKVIPICTCKCHETTVIHKEEKEKK